MNNNLNDSNNFLLSLASKTTNTTGGINHNENDIIGCTSLPNLQSSYQKNMTESNSNGGSIYSNNNNLMGVSNTNDIDFASLLLNINPNDYMLPSINFSNNNTNMNNHLNSGGVTSSNYNSTGGFGSWEWSAFNSGMISAASIDCSSAINTNNIPSDPLSTISNNTSAYQLQNLSNFISGVGTTNSKGQSFLANNNGNVYGHYPNLTTTNCFNSCPNNIMPTNGNGFAFSNSNMATNINDNNINLERQPSNLNQMDSLIGNLSCNISKMSNYEIDAQRAYNCLPQAIHIVNNSSEVEATRSAYLIYLLSKKEACRYVLCGCSSLSATLVNAILRYPSNQNIIRYCTAVIYHLLSSDNFIRQYVSTPNSIRVICELTTSTIEAIAFYSVATVHTLLVKFADLRNEVLAANCFEKLVPLLKTSNYKFVTLIADVLHFLVVGNNQLQINVVNSGLHVELVNILKTSKFEKLLFTVCRFVKSLSSNNAVKLALIQHNVVNALTELLLNKSRRIACTSLWTIRNLSDMCLNGDPSLKELLLICTRFILSQINDNNCNTVKNIQSNFVTYDINNNIASEENTTKTISEPSLVGCAVGILANLTCNNQENKEIIVRYGGLEALVTLCANANHIREIIEPTMCALRNITSQHKYVDHAITTLKSLNNLSSLSTCLDLLYNNKKDDFFPQLKKSTLSVISNIVIGDESTLSEFIRLQVPEKTTHILRYSIEMIKQLFTVNNDPSTTTLDDSKTKKDMSKQISLYNKLIEDAIVLLFIFVGSSINRTTCGDRESNEIVNSIVNSDLLDVLTQLLFSDNTGVLSCVIGIYSAISKTSNGASLIVKKYFSSDSYLSMPITSDNPNDSVSSIIMSQLNTLANSCNFDHSIRGAATSLINTWSKFFHSGFPSQIFTSMQVTNNNTIQNMNHLGLNFSSSQNSPYNQHSLSSTPNNYSNQQKSNQPMYSNNNISNEIINQPRANFYNPSEHNNNNNNNNYLNNMDLASYKSQPRSS